MSDKDKAKKMPDPSESANDRIPVESALEKNAATDADLAPADLRNAYEESSGPA